MGLFKRGEFALSSGEHSDFKIDCDALTVDDLEAIVARAVRQGMVPRFRAVVPVPRGGVRLAAAFWKFVEPIEPGGEHFPILIVDDVLTTGASMERMRRGFKGDTVGFVVFARREYVPSWITPMFRMWTRPIGLPGD